jgi:hypothetical protein
VDEITSAGVVANGHEYELDCLIFATGFDVSSNYTRRAGYEIVGRAGAKLSEKWARRSSTYQSFFTCGFPNCFFMMGFQSGLTPNIPHTINEQSQHLAYVIQEVLARGATSVAPSPRAEPASRGRLVRRDRQGQQLPRDPDELHTGLLSGDVSADGAGECRFVFRHLFMDDSYDHTAYLPSYREWFDAQSITGQHLLVNSGLMMR